MFLQHTGDNEIEEAPEDVDGCGGQTLSGWRCERTLEGMPRNSINQMGYGVCEKSASEKVCQIMIPAHSCSPRVKIKASIAVGMPVTEHPPHRSRRAQFGHRAPTSDV
jgi:hypothetical protein